MGFNRLFSVRSANLGAMSGDPFIISPTTISYPFVNRLKTIVRLKDDSLKLQHGDYYLFMFERMNLNVFRPKMASGLQ